MHKLLTKALSQHKQSDLQGLLLEAIKEYGLNGCHPAAEIFPIMDDDQLTNFIDDIAANGFSQSAIVTSDMLLIDGRNRMLASIATGKELSIEEFTPEDPIQYVLTENLHRRHLDSGQRAIVAAKAKGLYAAEAKKRQTEALKRGNVTRHQESPIVVNLPQSAKDDKPQFVEQQLQKSRDLAGKQFNVSGTYVSRAEALLNESPDLAKQVETGQTTLNKAYQQHRKRQELKPSHDPQKPPESSAQTIILETHKGDAVTYPKPKGEATFNRTNNAVEWASWTWNPVTGCLHGCKYCYAREIAGQEKMKPFYPVGFTPLFHHERLDAPKKTNRPKTADTTPEDGRVFVCSMADLFGAWVPEHWIQHVMESAIESPEWEYLFLTKFPQRLHKLDLPSSAWIGASIDTTQRTDRTLDALRKVEGVRVKWLSIEPLLEPLSLDLTGIDWVVVGAQSATNQPDGHHSEFAPPFEWVMDIVAQARRDGAAVYLKSNLLGVVNDQWPGMTLPQEMPATVNPINSQLKMSL